MLMEFIVVRTCMTVRRELAKSSAAM